MNRVLTVALCLSLPAVALAEVRWTGDFETADLRQWTTKQLVAPDRAQVVTAPMRQGRYAVKITVRQGDNPIRASGNRAELTRATYEPNGSEFYYRFSTLFPSTFPNVNKWQLFAQFHQLSGSGCPPVEFYVVGSEMRLRTGGCNGKVVWTAPLARGQWNDFVFRVKWSPNPSVGFMELYRNGKLEMPKRYMATQYSGSVNYFKIGLYRHADIAPTGILYHDWPTQATSLSSVSPTASGALPLEASANTGPVIPPTSSPDDLQVDPTASWESLPEDPNGPTPDEGAALISETLQSIPVDSSGEPLANAEYGPLVGCASMPGTRASNDWAWLGMGGMLFVGIDTLRKRRRMPRV